MRSLILSILTTLAFGVFCSATPTPNRLAADYSPHAEISARDETKTMNTILSGVITTVGPISDKITTAQTDADTMRDLLEQVRVTLLGAANDLAAISDVKTVLKSAQTGNDMDSGEMVALLSDFLGVFVRPVMEAIRFCPMSVLVQFAFELLDILRVFLQLALPAIYTVIQLSGVLKIVQNAFVSFVKHALS